MKHLKEFINEVYQSQIKKYSNLKYKIGLNLFDYVGKIGSKDSDTKRYAITANEVLKMVDKFASTMKANNLTYSLDNKQHLGKAYRKFLADCKFAESDKELKLKQFYLDTPEHFRGFWLSNADLLQEKNVYLDWINQLNGKTLGNEYKKYLKSDEYIKPIKKEDIQDLSKVNPNYIIVYSRWEPDTYELFEYVAESSDKDSKVEHMINMFKMNFHFDCKVEYFECYPIQVKNYIGKEKELNKNADSQEGYYNPSEY